MGKRLSNAPMLVFIAALVLGCGSEASGDETAGGGDGVGSITVGDFSMEWSVEGNSLSVTASAPTTGWIAVGFEPSAAMKDADIVIGYVEDGQVFISDDWGDGHISHSPDTELGGTSDVTGVSGTETDGRTEISFSIPMSSGDAYDKVLQQGSTIKMILAYGPDDADDFQGYHAWADTIELEL
jgi:hypothetical protein